MTMELREFHNALRILRGIERADVAGLTDSEWERFRRNPFDYFIRCTDDQCNVIWNQIDDRNHQPKRN